MLPVAWLGPEYALITTSEITPWYTAELRTFLASRPQKRQAHASTTSVTVSAVYTYCSIFLWEWNLVDVLS